MENTGRGRQRASVAVFLILIITSGLFLIPSARAAGATIYLHMLGEEPLADAGVPVMVAGIWHEVLVNLSANIGGAPSLRGAPPPAGGAGKTKTHPPVREKAKKMCGAPPSTTLIPEKPSLGAVKSTSP